MQGSALSWIDFSEKDRRKMLDIVALFQERDTRDELGIGSIRDAFADILFPGTSTIQTRARYMLFVPWIYLRREKYKTSSSRISGLARSDEINLIKALIKGGESEGVIGIEAGKHLQRLPSSVYWAGLNRWGIRRFNGSVAQYCHSLDYFYRSSQSITLDDDQEPLFGNVPTNWDPGIPEMPTDLFTETTLSLSLEEAEYLAERTIFSCKSSLLAHLVDRSSRVKSVVKFIWLHPDREGFPPQLEEIVENARKFSKIMQGAALMYNLMLAEKGNYMEWRAEYQDKFEAWSSSIKQELDLFKNWDLNRFWDLATSEGARIGFRTRQFVSQWIGLILRFASSFDVLKSKDARCLIEEREFFLKRGRARLRNPRQLELWRGASGTAPLDYRWSIVRVMLNDILLGRGRSGGDD